MHWAGCGTGEPGAPFLLISCRPRRRSRIPSRNPAGLVDDEAQLHYRGLDDVHLSPNTTAYIAHFENLFAPRWRRTNPTQRWLFDKVDGPHQRLLDRAAAPVLARCDPTVIHKFD